MPIRAETDARRRAALLLPLALLLAGAVPSVARAQSPTAYVGVTEAVADVRLSLPVDGIVDAVAVREGDWIEKGAVLVSLDARLETLEAERRRLILQERARIEATRARAATLRTMLDNARRLFDRAGAVSADEVRKLELEHLEATALVRELEDQKVRERIDLEIATERRRQKTLVAPIAGVVTEVRVDAGERVGAGEAIVRIVDTRRCYLVANVDERFARTLRKDDRASLAVRAGDGLIEKEGWVVAVAPVADPASGLVRVKLEFANEDGRILPGVAGQIRAIAATGGP